MKLRLWFFWKRIKHAVMCFYDSRVFAWLRSTLLYNILKMFLLVLFLLAVLFQFVPRAAHVAYTSNELDDVKGVQAAAIEMDIRTNRATLAFEKDEVKLSFHNIRAKSINLDYEGDCQILLQPTEDWGEWLSSGIMIGPKNGDDLHLKVTKILTEEAEPLISLKRITPAISVESTTGFFMACEDEMHMSLLAADGFLVEEDGTKIPLPTGAVSIFPKSNGSFYWIECRQDTMLEFRNEAEMKEYTQGTITMRMVETISTIGTGTMKFSYAPSGTVYKLDSQLVDLHSENLGLTATISTEPKGRSLEINGIVDQAEISGMSLFPSFFGWYRENIYLAPFTLITTVFGGVTLMMNQKKKQK